MQTEVNEPAIGVAGQLSDHHSAANGDVASFTSEEEEDAVAFGLMVGQGTGARQFLKIATNEDVPAGILVHGHHYATPQELLEITPGVWGVKPGVTVGVLRRGRMLVYTEESVGPTDPVFVRAVEDLEADPPEYAGAFRKSADGDTIDCSAFARFRSEADAGDLVEIEVDMMNAALAEPES